MALTSYADHRVWQDVYHAATPVPKEAYIKITLRDAAPLPAVVNLFRLLDKPPELLKGLL
ncbi:MAG: type II toxin-antitoxin system MqsR family toxin [Alphaproteobacteria bacterium]